MNNQDICPKCKCKIQWKPYKVFGKGCDYCKPKCSYCGEYLTTFLMEHHKNCKVFQKMIKEEKMREKGQ